MGYGMAAIWDCGLGIVVFVLVFVLVLVLETASRSRTRMKDEDDIETANFSSGADSVCQKTRSFGLLIRQLPDRD